LIHASHIVIYSQDAEADRIFFRDVLSTPPIDAGGGWLIFALPPAEVAFHPSAENNRHELYLMCDDLVATIKELEDRGVKCGESTEEQWGSATKIMLPGGGKIGLYQPRHPIAASASG
jgi:hypothetical protein